ncbi:MAG: bacteriophage holin [Verrucomicrobia bacterium]|nr:bacteriophage holin [Verrucomicrobiota bacterium]
MLVPSKLGLAGGVIWALCMFVTTIISIHTGYAELFLQTMQGVYPGYSISWGGSIVGLIYGFFDVFIGLYLLAWFYNKLI